LQLQYPFNLAQVVGHTLPDKPFCHFLIQ
jgi:hypothetical protein